MTIREFRAGNNKYVIENEKDIIFTLKCYEGEELISEKSYAKECYALSALRNKNNGELPEEVTGQMSDLIEVSSKDIIVRKPKLSDVVSREDYIHKLSVNDWCYTFEKERLFSLSGYSNVSYVRVNKDYFLLKKDNVERKYRVTVVRDYNYFVRKILYPEVEFELSFEDLFDEEHVEILKDKINNVGNSYLDLAFYLYRFKKNKVSSYSTDGRFLYNADWLNIYDFAEKYLGFCKTTTKNMIAIVEKFADKEALALQEGYEDYSYSQLSELCSVDNENLDEFNSKMTIKEIREKKKELKTPAKSTVSDSKDEKFLKFGIYESIVKNEASWRNEFQKQEVNEDNFYKKLFEYCDKEFVATDYYFKGGYGDNHITFFEFITGCLSFLSEVGTDAFKGVLPGFITFRNVKSLSEGLIKNGYVNNPALRIKEK